MKETENKRVVLFFPKLEKPQPGRIHYLPLSVLALGTVINREGYEVTIIDSRIEDDYAKRIDEIDEAPLCFGISSIIGYQVTEGIRIARLLKKRFPETPIVWGGWFPTMLPEVTVTSSLADVVVKGQGEFSFLELLECIRRSGSLSEINGITYMENGEIINTPDRPLEDPTTFPPPNYELIDLGRYNSIQQGSINYQTSRGCPFRCKFCCTPRLYGHYWKGLEPERILDELESIVKKYDIKHVEFIDDNFFTNRNRAAGVLEGMIERKLNLTYTATVRINNLVKFEPEVFDLIKRSGCETLYASSESGTDKILEVIQKDITVEQIRKMARTFKEHEIPARTTFMVGLPEETHEDLRSTLLLSKELFTVNENLDVYYSFFLPIPGTDFYEDAKAAGVINEPQTFEGWARCVPVDQRQFRLFLTTSDNLSTGKRADVKKIAFYFWFGHFPRLGKLLDEHKILFPLRAFRKVCAWRFDKDFFAFPIEWWIFRLFWGLKLFLFEPKDVD